VFTAFAAEELAAWGSYNHVLRHLDRAETTVGMVNLDALGLPAQGTRVLVVDPAMAEFARRSAASTGWEAEAEMDASLFPYADYIPFIDAGIPSCWVWRFPPQHPYYHSAGDTLGYINFRHVEDIAVASAFIAFRLAHDAELGIGRARPSRRWSTAIHRDTRANPSK
jgi:Zn-dependent M28 family amino/carboxypeptidase